MNGWYPDPSGTPGRFRHWDGAVWSEETTLDPRRTPAPAPRRPPTDRRNRGWIIALVVLVLITAIVIVWVLLSNPGARFTPAQADSNSATPTAPGWNETDTPTESPPPTLPSDGPMVPCPTTHATARTTQAAGRTSSGGLSFADPGGSWERFMSWQFPFTYDMHGLTLTITGGWFADLSVARVAKADWDGGPAVISTLISQCVATSDFYHSITGVSVDASASLTVSGRPAWWVTSSVRVSDPPGVQGDRVDVIIVDLGDDKDYYGAFLSACTIDQRLGRNSCPDVDTAIASLRVG